MEMTRDVAWALTAALLAYALGWYANPEFSARAARYPWRWLGITLRWFALPGIVYVIEMELWLARVFPGPLGAWVWALGLSLSLVPAAVCFVAFLVAWAMEGFPRWRDVW